MSSAVMGGAEGAVERWNMGVRTPIQGLFGAIAIILGIVGLALASAKPNVAMYLAAIAEIAMGLSLIAAGTALTVGYARLLARTEAAGEGGSGFAGTTVDMFLGGSAIILAVLAILRVAPEVLIPIAVIVIGVGLMLNSAASVRFAHTEAQATSSGSIVVRRVTEEMVFATASVRAVAGVAVVVLGILGLVALGGAGATAASSSLGSFIAAFQLALVAMIVGGAALLLNATSLSGRIIGVMTR